MLDDEIEAHLDAIPAAQGITAGGERAPDPGPDPAVPDAAARLAEIPGVSEPLARAIIAETGLDASTFPTAAHLAARAGRAPVTRQSGNRSSQARGHGDTWLKGYRTQAAHGASETATFPGERYRRLGGIRAQCATARSILVIIWHLLNNPPPVTATSDPTGTRERPAASARPAATSASWKPSATPSASPRTPQPRPAPDDHHHPAPARQRSRGQKPCPHGAGESPGHTAR